MRWQLHYGVPERKIFREAGGGRRGPSSLEKVKPGLIWYTIPDKPLIRYISFLIIFISIFISTIS